MQDPTPKKSGGMGLSLEMDALRGLEKGLRWGSLPWHSNTNQGGNILSASGINGVQTNKCNLVFREPSHHYESMWEGILIWKSVGEWKH